jgi:hypothetical protein
MLTLLILAAADPGGSLLDVFLQQGVLGAVAAAGGSFAWGTVKRERAAADAANARLQTQQEWVQTQVVPVLTRATDVLIRLAEVLPDSPRRS